MGPRHHVWQYRCYVFESRSMYSSHSSRTTCVTNYCRSALAEAMTLLFLCIWVTEHVYKSPTRTPFCFDIYIRHELRHAYFGTPIYMIAVESWFVTHVCVNAILSHTWRLVYTVGDSNSWKVVIQIYGNGGDVDRCVCACVCVWVSVCVTYNTQVFNQN